MAFLKFFLLFIIIGCSACKGLSKQEYEHGYRTSAKLQIQRALKNNNNNESGYYWHQPLVQEVEIPAHVTNGIFIPKHKEIVIIKPGEWKKKTQEKEYENSQYIENSADITALPGKR